LCSGYAREAVFQPVDRLMKAGNAFSAVAAVATANIASAR
jgi:hypothetical protein